MVGEGYYLALLNLCRDASVRTTRATVDCSFTLGSGAVVAYSRSKLGNLLQLRRIGLWNALRLDSALRSSYDGSWGAFLSSRHLDDRNPAVSMLNAQLSWVLSASRTAVEGTPSKSILDYARRLALSLKTCLVGSRNFVSESRRPSEPWNGPWPLAAISGWAGPSSSRAIGVLTASRTMPWSRDAASAARRAGLVHGGPRCFRPLRDGDAIPHNTSRRVADAIKSQGLAVLSVTCASDDAASLTVWLNAFYPELKFDGDIFETWAPRTPPSHVIREVVCRGRPDR